MKQNVLPRVVLVCRNTVLTILLCASAPAAFCAEPGERDDDPVDRAFLLKTAQGYYDALVRKDFRTTADREIFVVMPSPADLAAYARAMQEHPYAVAERIAVEITDIDASRAYLGLRITVDGETVLKRATWFRTGTPKTWVVEMTRMTLAGMPGHEIIEDDYVA